MKKNSEWMYEYVGIIKEQNHKSCLLLFYNFQFVAKRFKLTKCGPNRKKNEFILMSDTEFRILNAKLQLYVKSYVYVCVWYKGMHRNDR